MSTPLIDEDSPEFSGIYFTRYYGGENRGVCFQITMSHDPNYETRYVQLTRSQLDAVIAAYKNEPPL